MVPLAKALAQNPTIEDLDLYDNNIGKRGSPAMVEALRALTSLKRLNLGDCMIDSKGIKEVLQIIKSLTDLEVLVWLPLFMYLFSGPQLR
jgi:Ran GTPase-activating protein (RanGAP) involved in mRNA processing and transport